MSRMPSTSTGTSSVSSCAAAAVSSSIRSGLLSGGSTSGSAASAASGTGSLRESVSRRAPARRAPRRAGARRRAARSSTGCGHDRLRELTLDHLGEEPLRRALVDAQLDTRRAGVEVGHERGTSHRLAVPTTPSARVAPPRAPGSSRGRRASPRARAAPAVPGRARPRRTRWASAPRRPRTRSVHAELVLELAHLLGHVRLHRVQRVGRGGERPLLGDRERASRGGAAPSPGSFPCPGRRSLVNIGATDG